MKMSSIGSSGWLWCSIWIVVCCWSAIDATRLRHHGGGGGGNGGSDHSADEPSYLELLLAKRSSSSNSGSALPSRHRQCPIYRNEALYSIVDRICELCFEMFRHQDPNLRAKCRSRCFQNEQFTSCVSILNPSLELGVVPIRRRQNNVHNNNND